MAGEAEKEVEDGKPKKVMDDHDIRWLCPARVALSDHFHLSVFMVKLMRDGFSLEVKFIIRSLGWGLDRNFE